MKREFIPIFLLLITILATKSAYAQAPTTGDCEGAIPVCQDYYFQPNTADGEGNYPNEIQGQQQCPYNCLVGERNSTWYRFTVQTSGMLRFTISPVDQTDDYDWAVYNLTTYDCDDIYNNAPQMVVSCNSVGSDSIPSWWGDTGAAEDGLDECSGPGQNGSKWNIEIPVTQGETYVLYVSDWSQTPPGYSLDFSESTAQIYDNTRPELQGVLSGGIVCNDNTFEFYFSEDVSCSTVLPNAFELEGPDGNLIPITDITGESCEIGGNWEKNYVATIDPAFTLSGPYVFRLLAFTGVSDQCGNTALPDSVNFVLNLNAPEIDDTDMDLKNSSCGEANGYIQDIDVSGNDSLTYEWKNASGDVVGTDVDLIDVPAGLYTLIVTDDQGCQALSPEYQIIDEGAPDIDESGLSKTDNTCGNNNGSITGITVEGMAPPFTYEWRDQNDNVVGTNLDLTGVSGGNYTLYVKDVNDCQSIAGPFSVADKPSPTIIDEDVFTVGENCGMSNGLIENMDVVGQPGLQYRWYKQPDDTIGSTLDLFDIPAGDYYFLARDENGCVSESGPFTVAAIEGPQFDLSQLDIKQANCGRSDGYIHGIEASGNSGLSYVWEDGDGNVIGDTSFLDNLAPGEYTLIVTDAAGCENIAGPYEIVNQGEPFTVNAAGPEYICSGEALQLTVDEIENADYQWTGPDGFSSDEQNPVIPDAQTTASGTYTVDVTSNPYGCEAQSGVDVEVYQTYDVELDISSTDTIIFPGQEVTFTAHAQNPGDSPVFEWIVAGEVWQSGSDSTFTTEEINTDMTVVCQLLAEEICAFPKPAVSNSLDIIALVVNLYVPNAFRPGSVHGNDEFKVSSIASEVAEFNMKIFDRWGKLIFESDDVTQGWDGTIKGEPAPRGVYIWMIDYALFDKNNQPLIHNQKGMVTLVR